MNLTPTSTERLADGLKSFTYSFDSFPTDFQNEFYNLNDKILSCSRSWCMLGGKAAALIAKAILTNDEELLNNYHNFISDYDVYTNKSFMNRGIEITSNYKYEIAGINNKPIQFIFNIPAANKLTRVWNCRAHIQLFLNSNQKHMADTIHNYGVATRWFPETILKSYDINASQAVVIYQAGNRTFQVIVSSEYLEYLQTNCLAFTSRQLAWFDYFISFQNQMPSYNHAQTLAQNALAVHLLIITTRMLKYLQVFPGAQSIDQVSMSMIRLAIIAMANKDLLTITDNITLDEEIENASSSTDVLPNVPQISAEMLKALNLPTTLEELKKQ